MTGEPYVEGYFCASCRWFDTTPTERCPYCRSEIKATKFTGIGTVGSFTIIRYPPKGFEGEAPYAVALIDLQHGPRVLGVIKENPDQLEVGRRVRLLKEENQRLEFQYMQ